MNGGGKDSPDSRYLKRAAGLVPVQVWVHQSRKAQALAILAPLVLDGKMRVETVKATRRKARREARLRAELSAVESEK